MGRDDVRAITVRQPWAHSIIYFGKRIENRSAGFTKKHRGLLLIHAGLAWSERGATDYRVLDGLPRVAALSRASFPTGAIIGAVMQEDAHLASGCCEPWGESSYTEAGGKTVHEITHLVLAEPFALPEPVPCAGRLGLWRPTDDVLAEVEAQLPGCFL